jgi:hypothetical protein
MSGRVACLPALRDEAIAPAPTADSGEGMEH